jgi:hypothetical protein
MAEIVRVYGRADSFDIELTRNGNKWEVDVPPDLSDGVYAVQLTAVNDMGETAHWVGELFMVGGVCCLRLGDVKFWTKLSAREYSVNFRKGRSLELQTPSEYVTELSLGRSVQIRKASRPLYSVRLTTHLTMSEPDPLHVSRVERKEIDVRKTRSLGVEYATPLHITLRKECRHAQR